MKPPRPALLTVPLACPHDALPLTLGEHGFRCAAGHNHDVSRDGYVNLLPVALKPSRDPGDSKAMVQARRAVMASGCFVEVADRLCSLVVPCLENVLGADSCSDQIKAVIDAGCGDGYFTTALTEHLATTPTLCNMPVLGVDISRWAVSSAARHYQNGAWAVGTNRCLPVASDAAALITSLFGYEVWTQWAELQHAGQWVVTASAGPQHLFELRQQVYNEVTVRHAEKSAAAEAAGYVLRQSSRIEYVADLDSADLAASLLAMTPHAHRVSAERRDAVSTLDLPRVSCDVILRAYQLKCPVK